MFRYINAECPLKKIITFKYIQQIFKLWKVKYNYNNNKENYVNE